MDAAQPNTSKPDTDASKDASPAQFLALTCQRGAENALKNEMARRRPNWKFSYSRPGFLTFKAPAPESLEKRLAITVPSLRLVFARSCVHLLGAALQKDLHDADGRFDRVAAAKRVWALVDEQIGPNSRDFAEAQRLARPAKRVARIHVFERDRFNMGVRDFEPGITDLAREIHKILFDAAPEETRQNFARGAERLDVPADPGELCLDVVLVEENEWRVGLHRVGDFHSRWPGGLLDMKQPTDAASRAFLKFEEGLRWAEFPIGIGSRCVDIGAAPGGGSQALLARGAETLGVDPAAMAPQLLAHPHFTHIRGKIGQVRRKLFRKSRWFITDMNVAPSYTLDALEELVGREDVAARGLLFTLKLFDWKLAEEIPSYLARVKSWGFNVVKARQLQFNRQEIMVAALKKPFHKDERAPRRDEKKNRKGQTRAARKEDRDSSRRPIDER